MNLNEDSENLCRLLDANPFGIVGSLAHSGKFRLGKSLGAQTRGEEMLCSSDSASLAAAERGGWRLSPVSPSPDGAGVVPGSCSRS